MTPVIGEDRCTWDRCRRRADRVFRGFGYCAEHADAAIHRYREEHCVPPGVHKFDLVTSNGDTVIARQCRRCGFVVPEARAG